MGFLLSLFGGSSVQIYIYLAVLFAGFGGGFYIEHVRFAEYQTEVENIAKVLKERGFLDEIKTFKPKGKSFKMLHLELALENGLPRITDVKRISKPGHRKYIGFSEIRKVAGGTGLQVISTSRGVLDSMVAKSKKLGGELICEVK